MVRIGAREKSYGIVEFTHQHFRMISAMISDVAVSSKIGLFTIYDMGEYHPLSIGFH